MLTGSVCKGILAKKLWIVDRYEGAGWGGLGRPGLQRGRGVLRNPQCKRGVLPEKKN